MKIFFLLLTILFFFSREGSAQVVSNESFDYMPDAVNDLVQQSNNKWKASDAGSTILVTDGNLSYPGAGIFAGNKISFSGDAKRYEQRFDKQADGTIYVSLIFRLTKLPGTTTGDYFIGLSNGHAGFGSPVYIRASTTAGKFNIGLSKRQGQEPAWVNKDLNPNESYYIVFSMTRLDGKNNDVSKLWIDPAPGGEPTPDIDIKNENGDFNNFANLRWLTIHHSGTANAAMKIDLDELKVSKSWIGLSSTNVPSAPSELATVVKGSTEIDLSWTDNSNNETGFSIERSVDGITFQPIFTVAADAVDYSDTGLTAATGYHYRIAALSPVGNSGYSNVVLATTTNDVQALITEPFDYMPSSTNDLAVQSGGKWTIKDATGNPVYITTGNLSYPGAPPSSGNKISFEGGTKRYDLSFIGKKNGTIYASFMLKVTELPSNSGGDYFIYFGNSVKGVICPVYLRSSATPGKFNIGLGKRNNLPVSWVDKNLNVKETYYVVFSMTYVDGKKNDISKMWINPNPGTEPPADVSISNGADLNNFLALKRVVINHSNNGNDGVKMDIDEINVAAEWIELTGIPAPSAPGDLVAVSSTGTTINLSWKDNSTDETGFEVVRSTDGITFSHLASLAEDVTTYTDEAPAEFTKYYYRVRAKNSGGNSGYSNIANATTKSLPPESPTSFKVKDISSNSVGLSWTDNSNKETGFELERSLDGVTFSLLTDLPANTESYTDIGLSPMTSYYYRVRATGVPVNSDYSKIDSAVTPASIPLSPEGLTATAASSKEIVLKWEDRSNNESWFEIERSSDGTNFTLISTEPSNTAGYTDKNIESATQYYYRVRATGLAGNSGYSNVANVTTSRRAKQKIEAINILTPNGDGRNDFWIVRHIDEYTNNVVSVFDRTGKLVFHKKNYSNDWDGTYQGSPLSDGAYIYVIELGKGAAPVKGILTIIH